MPNETEYHLHYLENIYLENIMPKYIIIFFSLLSPSQHFADPRC